MHHKYFISISSLSFSLSSLGLSQKNFFNVDESKLPFLFFYGSWFGVIYELCLSLDPKGFHLFFLCLMPQKSLVQGPF
jgi:hypothetical protein